MTARFLDRASLRRWRANAALFVEEVLHNPEDGKPYVLLPAERAFLNHCFRTGADGRLLYEEQLYSCPKKSGKTAFAAMHCLTTTLLFGGAYPEVTLAANDYDQAQGRVFEAVRRIVERSPLLVAEAKVTAERIPSPQSAPPSQRLLLTTLAPPAAIRRSRASTSFGLTLRSVPAVYGTSSCRRLRVRSLAG
jgi:hypothetical protein